VLSPGRVDSEWWAAQTGSLAVAIRAAQVGVVAKCRGSSAATCNNEVAARQSVIFWTAAPRDSRRVDGVDGHKPRLIKNW